jgi:hypothetical protein
MELKFSCAEGGRNLAQPSTSLVEYPNQGEVAKAKLGVCSLLASYRRGAGLNLPGN